VPLRLARDSVITLDEKRPARTSTIRSTLKRFAAVGFAVLGNESRGLSSSVRFWILAGSGMEFDTDPAFVRRIDHREVWLPYTVHMGGKLFGMPRVRNRDRNRCRALPEPMSQKSQLLSALRIRCWSRLMAWLR